MLRSVPPTPPAPRHPSHVQGAQTPQETPRASRTDSANDKPTSHDASGTPARTCNPPPRRAPCTIVAADGYRLSATRFATARSPRAYLVVAGAVGVTQRFYQRFARFARARGFHTITFDYRGIGGSAPADLRHFRMDFQDWGRLDLAAVIEAAHADATRDGVPLYLMAHSFGGHAFGLLPNHQHVRACYTFGTGSGWHGWMPRMERWRVAFLWNVAGPILTAWKGYLPWRMVRMGEDLPLDVYRQWRDWVRHPHFLLDDPYIGVAARAAFARVRTPIAAASADDDRWSTHRSCDAMLSAFTSARVHRLHLAPSTLNVGPIGHMGFFRSRAEPLWNDALTWLEGHDD